MKFLSNMDGANRILEDSSHRFVTDAEKTAWNAKQAAITGGASTIATSNLSTSKALISNSSGKVAVSAVTSTELGYLDGVTSNVQTQLNGKAPTSHSHSISNLTDFPTSMPANGGDSDTVDGKHASDFALSTQVLTNVPAGAKFTDTVYTHPTTDGNKHVPATGTTNNGKVLKAGATAGSLSWANDNDTITTINGKTGAIAKADIVALGIPAQDTVYTHPSAHPASMITQTSSYRFVTDTEKSTWNAKASTAVATTSANGLMSSADKTKLNGVATGANNYSHPASHPPSIITQDESNRFVTDAQISAWDAKQNALGSGTTSQYLRGDGTWATPPNTSYSTMSVSEGNAGTATTSRVMRADYLKQIIMNHIPSSLPANGGNANTLGGKLPSDFVLASQVLTNVPAGAKFTDTVYTHPASHPASIITQNASNRFVTDAQISAWNAKGTSNLALGTTSSTAYRGDYGNIAYTHSQAAHAPTNAQANQTITSGNGMAAWTATSGNLTITLGTPGAITNTSANAVTTTSHTHAFTLQAHTSSTVPGVVGVMMGTGDPPSSTTAPDGTIYLKYT